MKRLFSGLLLLAAWLALVENAPAASKGPQSSYIGGRAYVPVTAWARDRELEVRWLKREELVQLSNRSGSIILKMDSKEARVFGVTVWLSFPVVNRNGTLYVSQSDIQSTLNPLLRQEVRRNSRGRVNVICLDPGHGGKDSGYRVGSRQEKLFTLLLAHEVREQLLAAGFKVVMTRSGDSFVDLPERPAMARHRGADLFVSLHFNSMDGAGRNAQGAEVYCLTPAGAASTNAQGDAGDKEPLAANRNNDENLLLAYRLQKALIRNLAVEDRGVRRARFAVLREASMPAVLVEAGFLSHPAEGGRILRSTYRRQIAEAIVDAITEYKRLAQK